MIKSYTIPINLRRPQVNLLVMSHISWLLHGLTPWVWFRLKIPKNPGRFMNVHHHVPYLHHHHGLTPGVCCSPFSVAAVFLFRWRTTVSSTWSWLIAHTASKQLVGRPSHGGRVYSGKLDFNGWFGGTPQFRKPPCDIVFWLCVVVIVI